MILIDAVFIHTGGGKSLLDYLVSELKKTNAQVFYLLDQRYKPQFPVETFDNIEFVDGFFNRCKFYKKNGNRFRKIFCLGNIPPHIRLKNIETIVYLHSASYLEPVIQTTIKQKATQYIKNLIFNVLVKNAQLWMVQTEYMSNLLKLKYNFPENKVKILPFFKTLEKDFVTDKKRYSFFYPGTAEPHKNHKRLIDAFCLFHDQYKIGELYLTVEERFKDVFDYIEFKKINSYPIYNLGYISDKKNMAELYSKSEYLVFPSLMESFGLPLIEATEFNCKILAANLTYVTQVCIPSSTFDPYDIQNMSKAFEETVHNSNLPESYAIVHNRIDSIINYIVV